MAYGEDSRNGLGIMELVYWEEDMGKERNKKRKFRIPYIYGM